MPFRLIASLRPEDVTSILYFSDRAPQGIAKALKTAFPHSHEAGASYIPDNEILRLLPTSSDFWRHRLLSSQVDQ
jgi:hypothetical protein